MKVSGVAETVTVTTGDAASSRRRARPSATTLNQTTIEIDADSRPQVRGSADAHARRQRRAGAGRRRDHVRRPARRLQQHQPRRRRLQQRLLRRAGRRPARRDRHHARGGQGVPGDRQRRAGRVRPHRRRRRQRHHQVGHQRDARQPVPLPAAGRADRRSVRRDEARGVPPRAVRRHARRPDQARTRRSTFSRSRASPATSSGRT